MIKDTKTFYNQPQSFNQAAVFGDVNSIQAILFGLNQGRLLLYPEDIEIVPDGISVEVQESFFQGKDYLIKAQILKTSTVVFFKAPA